MAPLKGSLEYCIEKVSEEVFEGLGKKDKANLADEIRQRQDDLIKSGKTQAEAQAELFTQIAKEKNRDAKLNEAHKLQQANAAHDVLTFIDNTGEMDESQPLIAQIASLPIKNKAWSS